MNKALWFLALLGVGTLSSLTLAQSAGNAPPAPSASAPAAAPPAPAKSAARPPSGSASFDSAPPAATTPP
ncbi:MAG TPA: hypothetical protein VM686_06510, partial [Polyangiaceae bacterium]|nr:hypothetical protein [Polyangiaceae bacterium]